MTNAWNQLGPAGIRPPDFFIWGFDSMPAEGAHRCWLLYTHSRETPRGTEHHLVVMVAPALRCEGWKDVPPSVSVLVLITAPAVGSLSLTTRWPNDVVVGVVRDLLPPAQRTRMPVPDHFSDHATIGSERHLKAQGVSEAAGPPPGDEA